MNVRVNGRTISEDEGSRVCKYLENRVERRENSAICALLGPLTSPGPNETRDRGFRCGFHRWYLRSAGETNSSTGTKRAKQKRLRYLRRKLTRGLHSGFASVRTNCSVSTCLSLLVRHSIVPSISKFKRPRYRYEEWKSISSHAVKRSR